jgi:hypothetical protein
MTIRKFWKLGATTIFATAVVAGCGKGDDPAPARVAPPVASEEPRATSSASLTVSEQGSARF